MKRNSIALLVLLLALVLALAVAACGGEEGTGTTAPEGTETTAGGTETTAPADDPAAAAGLGEAPSRCAARVPWEAARAVGEPMATLGPDATGRSLLLVSAGLQWLAGLGFVANTWPRVTPGPHPTVRLPSRPDGGLATPTQEASG